MATIIPAFDKFPKEGEIIGRLLSGYGELELMLCFCVAAARNDFDMVFKAMFRPRGESQRIHIADAMGRMPFKKLSIGRQFSEAVESVRYCLKIRNRYAHCYWTDDYGRQLGFVQLEDTAEKSTLVNDVFHIPATDVDLKLLQNQEAYFVYTSQCLNVLQTHAKGLATKATNGLLTFPEKVWRPNLSKPR